MYAFILLKQAQTIVYYVNLQKRTSWETICKSHMNTKAFRHMHVQVHNYMKCTFVVLNHFINNSKRNMLCKRNKRLHIFYSIFLDIKSIIDMFEIYL